MEVLSTDIHTEPEGLDSDSDFFDWDSAMEAIEDGSLSHADGEDHENVDQKRLEEFIESMNNIDTVDEFMAVAQAAADFADSGGGACCSGSAASSPRESTGSSYASEQKKREEIIKKQIEMRKRQQATRKKREIKKSKKVWSWRELGFIALKPQSSWWN